MVCTSGLAAAAKVAIYGTLAADNVVNESGKIELHPKDNAAMVFHIG